MKILITGNLGFIGTNLSLHLLKEGYDIIGVDKISYCSNKDALEIMKSKHFKFVKANVNSRRILNNLVEKSDLVIHLAASSHVDNSIKRPGDFLTDNVLGTYSVLESIRKFKKTLIHFSTDEVYGEIKRGSASESHNFHPGNPYSATKVSEEALIRSYIKTYNIKAIILRPTNAYGPWQYPEKFIPKTILSALNNKKIPVYGDGSQIREWLFIDDLCEAVSLIIKKRLQEGIFNIGSGLRMQNIKVVKLILRLMDKDENLIKFVTDRAGHDIRYSVNSSKINRSGWKSKTSFKEGIKRTISWYVKNNSKYDVN